MDTIYLVILYRGIENDRPYILYASENHDRCTEFVEGFDLMDELDLIKIIPLRTNEIICYAIDVYNQD